MREDGRKIQRRLGKTYAKGARGQSTECVNSTRPAGLVYAYVGLRHLYMTLTMIDPQNRIRIGGRVTPELWLHNARHDWRYAIHVNGSCGRLVDISLI